MKHLCFQEVYFLCVYFTTLQVLGLFIYRRMVLRFLNDELEKILTKAAVAYYSTIPLFVWGDWGKPRETSLEVTVVRADIWTTHLSKPVESFPATQARSVILAKTALKHYKGRMKT
jgi:hypothetical protein